MREESRETSASATAAGLMISSQVKEALNKLDKADANARRTTLNSIKQCVEAMDAASVPRLIAQVSEAKESSRAYAISLYEDVARVHGKLMSPHVPRVMTTITKTLSSSGSSPQLQQACAKVISAVVKYVVDEQAPAQASDVLKDLCKPLLEVLTGKLEPLAAGAALCLQTLVESDKWKYASSALVEDLCLKTTLALAEKRTRTVAHMQLARSLAASNSSFLASYGVTLLRSGVDVLRSSATSTSWQQRASAARLLTAVLPTVDRATLAEELNITVQVLDNCKHDRMSNVRWAVREALKTARGVLSEENSRRSRDGDELLLWMNASLEPSSSSPRRTSSLGGVSSDDMLSPPTLTRTAKSYHRGSPVSSVIPLSPSAPSRSHVTAATALALGEMPLRSPLRVTRMENLRSHDSDTQTRTKTGTLAMDSDLSPRKPPMTAGAALQHSLDPGGDNLGGYCLAEEDDMLLLSNGNTPPRTDSGHESSEQLEIRSRRDVGVKDSPTNAGASRSYHGVLNRSTMKHVFELKGPGLRSSPWTREDDNVAAVFSPSKTNNSEWKEASKGPLGSSLRSGAFLQLSSSEESFSPQNAQPLLGVEDFLPFSTPRQLVRSLQESFMSTHPGSCPARYADHDLARVSRDEVDFGDTMGTDMDLGTPTSTSTGWSVCTNPIASEESLRMESDDSDHEQQRASWKTMTLCLLPPTSPTAPAPHTPPAQETDNQDLSDGFIHRLTHSSSGTASFTQPQEISETGKTSGSLCGENTVEPKPEVSNAVDINRMLLKEGPHATLLCACTAQGNGVVKWCCSVAQSQRSEDENGVVTTFEVTADSDEGSDSSATTVSVVAQSFEKDSLEIMEVEVNETKTISRRGWMKRLSNALFRWQVCVVIGSIPLAFVLSKVVFSSDPRLTGYLVPT